MKFPILNKFDHIAELSLSQAQVKLLTFTTLLGASLLVPAVIHNQLITGPIVNALLFLSASLLGSEQAILIGLIPSTAAVSRGLLPLAMAPMMPFIMLSNTILISIFSRLRTTHPWLGIIAGSAAKAGFLSLIAYLVMPDLVPSAVAGKLQAGMSWVQLMTALAGGGLYRLVIQVGLKREYPAKN